MEKGREVALEGAPAVPLREVDGHLIGEGNCCVYESGIVISVSRLGVSQLRAELTARGLPADGLRNTLYRRVQARMVPSLFGAPAGAPAGMPSIFAWFVMHTADVNVQSRCDLACERFFGGLSLKVHPVGGTFWIVAALQQDHTICIRLSMLAPAHHQSAGAGHRRRGGRPTPTSPPRS